MTVLPPEQDNLPVPSPLPALVIGKAGNGPWTISQIAPQLAEAVTGRPETGVGRRLDRVFDQTTPPLSLLADRCLDSGQSVDALVQLLPDVPSLQATFKSRGLSDDYSQQQIAVWFRQPDLSETPEGLFHGMVGISDRMQALFQRVRLYGRSEAAVVITGETGTGKELIARALHEESPRAAGPYVAVNCSAISEELLESELFGHEKGAFTGAVKTHKGRFERADGGTLFLDEVGDMPLHTQTKLLRVLEEGVVERVGAESELPVDVRVVCATHVPLEQAVAEGRFRSDLYHRLAVLRLHLPSLRERREDIPALADHFLSRFSERYGRAIDRLTPEAMDLLQAYLWPGNIRELRNVLERVFIETPGEVIGIRAFSEWVRERQDFAPGDWTPETAPPINAPINPPGTPLLEAAPVLEAEVLSSPAVRTGVLAPLTEENIRQAYHACDRNLTHAARQLGVHRATLYRHLDRLGLSRDDL